MLPFAPGSRVVIRDEEWLVRRIDPATDGGWLLTCDGISELVRSQSALFLTTLEDEIAVLDPEKTELDPDDTPAYNASILYLESQRRRNVANADKVHLGHRGVMQLIAAVSLYVVTAYTTNVARVKLADDFSADPEKLKDFFAGKAVE